MNIQRKNYLKLRRQVITTQAVVRAYLVRKLMERKRRAATLIQKYYRGYQATKIERTHYLKQRQSAVIIQSFIRMAIKRKQYLALKKWVLLVQTRVRGIQARRDTSNKKEAILCIQKYWRNIQVSRQCRRQYVQTRGAAVYIQAWWRMSAKRNQFAKMKKAAVFMQKNIRRNLQMSKFKVSIIISNLYLVNRRNGLDGLQLPKAVTCLL